MALSWRKRRGGGRLEQKKLSFEKDLIPEIAIPTQFLCPISLDLMRDPVSLSTGITYDRVSIERWFEAGNRTCPVTNLALSVSDAIPNHALRKMIQDWCVANQSHGVERIPTPRVPLTSHDVSMISLRVSDSTRERNAKKCSALVGKIKMLAKESERNGRLIAGSGIGYVLASAFDSFSTISVETNSALLEEILFLLTWMLPLGEEGMARLGSKPSFHCMGTFLKGDNLSAKKSTVLALQELLAADQDYSNRLIKIEGIPEALFNILKDPICPTTTKATLTIIYHSIMDPLAGEKTALRFLDLGLFEFAVEALVDADRGLTERCLRVLDRLSSFKEGMRRASGHRLTVPILVKKVLRVSATVTDLCVSILYKLGKSGDEGEGDGSALAEAIQFGVFQKLLVVLQVDCGEGTRKKANGLLKLTSRYKDRSDCFDSSVHFKFHKRSN